MRRVTLDASVVVKWFTRPDEPGKDEALAWRAECARGAIEVVVPHLPGIEVLNVAGRRWGWPDPALAELAQTLRALPFDVVSPSLPAVARRVGRGLTSYDATSVAVAEETGCPVVTADEQMLTVAPSLTAPLARS